MALKTKAARMSLTRADMEKVIKDGKGAVMHQGQIITKIEDLPTEVDLAIGDPSAEATQDAAIERQINALEKERVRLARVRAQRAQQQEAAEAEADVKPKRGGRRKTAGKRPGRKPKGEAATETGTAPTASAGPGGADASE